MSKYNIALVPSHKVNQFFDYFKKIAVLIKPYKYRLGMALGESYPHVTLCQFEAESHELDAIWEKLTKLSPLSLNLVFDRQRTKTYPKENGWEDVAWISLMCDGQFDALKKLHLEVAEIVTPINSAYANYDPHLTLLNTEVDEEECRDKIDRFPNVNPFIADKFIMVLGECDDSGQLTKILYESI